MTLIIFDFDGTIVDSLHVFIEATNHLAQKYGYPQVEQSQIPQIRALSSRALIQQIPIARWQLPFFLRGLRREVRQLSSKLKLFEGMEAALLELKAHNYTLGIVTSNSLATVEEVLNRQGLRSLFDFVHAGHGLLGKDRVLRRLMRTYSLQPTQIIYVGDETRDIEAAQQVYLITLAVSWGFSHHSVLARKQPDSIIDAPAKLLAAVEKLTEKRVLS